MSPSSESAVYAQPTASSPTRLAKPTPSVAASVPAYSRPHGGLSCPPSRLADIANRPCSATNAPTALESQLHQISPARPVSALPDYSHRDHNTSGPSPDPLTPPVFFRRPTSATSDALGHISSNQSSQQHLGSLLTIGEIAPDSIARPETAMLSGRPTTTDALLPPRRELPFQRSPVPSSSGSDSVRPHSRPSTGLMGPPPLPVRVTNLQPASSRGTIPEPELYLMPQPTLTTSPHQQVPIQRAPRTPEQNQGIHASTIPDATDYLQPASRWRCSSPSPLSLPAQAGPMGRSSLGSVSPPRTDGKLARPSTLHSIHAAPLPSDGLWSDLTAAKMPSILPLEHHDTLKSYAAQSEEKRRIALDGFILRHLESDDFMLLLQDMEVCFPRVALRTH